MGGEERNILILGAQGSGKSSLVRLLLGKYAVGESRDFYQHRGIVGQSKRAVKFLECPPIREDNQADYYRQMETAVSGLGGPVHSVLVVVKYSPIGFGGLRLDKEKNIPEQELLTLKKILGGGVRSIVSAVITNWSRQFARISERRIRGVTEDLVESKLKEEMAYSLSCTSLPIYFLDTVFWQTEQSSTVGQSGSLRIPNLRPNTAETAGMLISRLVGETNAGGEAEPEMKFVVPEFVNQPDLIRTGERIVRGQQPQQQQQPRPPQQQQRQQQQQQQHTTEYRSTANTTSSQWKSSAKYSSSEEDNQSSDSDDQDNTLGRRWRNKAYDNLTAEDSSSLQTSTLTFPVHKNVSLTKLDPESNYSGGRQGSGGVDVGGYTAGGARTGGNSSSRGRIVEDRSSARHVPIQRPKRSTSRSSSSSGTATEEANKSAYTGFSYANTSRSSNNDTSLNRSRSNDRVELSDYLEAKVKEMIDREGVVLDFSDSKLRGKIITKTRIIKEVTNEDGETEFVEDEEVDEKQFGSDLDSVVSGFSYAHSEGTASQRTEPVFSVGQPVLSTTFDRRQYESKSSNVSRYSSPVKKKIDQSPNSSYNSPSVGKKTTPTLGQTTGQSPTASSYSSYAETKIDPNLSSSYYSPSGERKTGPSSTESYNSATVGTKPGQSHYSSAAGYKTDPNPDSSHYYSSGEIRTGQSPTASYKSSSIEKKTAASPNTSYYSPSKLGNEQPQLNTSQQSFSKYEKEFKDKTHYQYTQMESKRETTSYSTKQEQSAYRSGNNFDNKYQPSYEEAVEAYRYPSSSDEDAERGEPNKYKVEMNTGSTTAQHYSQQNFHNPGNLDEKTVSSAHSSTNSSVMEDVHNAIDEVFERPQPTYLDNFDATIVVLGQEPNLSHVKDYLVSEQNVSNVLTCPVDHRSGAEPYRLLVESIPEGTDLVFVWTVATITGEINDDLVWMFGDFIVAFSDHAIESMIVVIWHPGTAEDIRESLEDLTKIVRNQLHYKSSLGFAVLQFKPNQLFYNNLSRLILDTQKMKFVKNDKYSSKVVDGSDKEDYTEPIVVSPVAEPALSTIESTVDSPVVLMVSPPGHGKSSLGNLLLGEGHFRVRGMGVGEKSSLQVNSAFLEDQFRITCIEAPGIYEEGVDKKSIQELDKHLRNIGFITHLVIVWDSLEWRLEDLDYVLNTMRKVFGVHIWPRLLFVVTFWDQEKKARKERSKRKLTFDSMIQMISDKVETIFGSAEEPLVYFVSARDPWDRSGDLLAKYLKAGDWPTFPTRDMHSWLSNLESRDSDSESEDDPGKRVEDDHDYESVGGGSTLRPTSDEKNFGKSKSLHNLAQSQGNLNTSHGSRGDLGGSMLTMPTNQPTRGRGRGKGRGGGGRGAGSNPFSLGSSRQGRSRGRLSESNLGPRSQSHGNIFLGGKTGGKGGRGRQRPKMNQQKSIENLYEIDNVPYNENVNSYHQDGGVSTDNDMLDAIVQDTEFSSRWPEENDNENRTRRRSLSRGRERRRVASGSGSSLFKFRSGSATGSNRQKSRPNIVADQNTSPDQNTRPVPAPRKRASQPNILGPRRSLSGNNRGSRGNLLENRGPGRDSSGGSRENSLARGPRTNLGQSRERGSRQNLFTRGRARSQSRERGSRQNLAQRGKVASQPRLNQSGMGARAPSQPRLNQGGGGMTARARSQSRNSLARSGPRGRSQSERRREQQADCVIL